MTDTDTRPTKDRLAAILMAAGLGDMAIRAANGWYDEFLSPLPTPITQLVMDLEAAGTPEASALAERARDGAFDGSDAESAAWASSPEGRKVLASLVGPTGDFPRGQHSPDDKGGLLMSLAVDRGIIKIMFGKPTTWIGLDKASALVLADILRRRADQIPDA